MKGERAPKDTNDKQKKGKRRIQEEYRDNIQKQMRTTDAMNVLAEGQSLKSTNALGLHSLLKPQTKTALRPKQNPIVNKSIHPFLKMTWDKVKAITNFGKWPNGSIDWSDFARQHGIPGRNWGQVGKRIGKRK